MMPLVYNTAIDLYDKMSLSSVELSSQDTIITSKPEYGIQGTSLEPTKVSSLSSSEQSKIIEFPRIKPSKISTSYFKVLNQWEGYVLDSNEETFRARIRDLTKPEMPDEEVVLSIDDITDEADIELAKPGAVFYLIIGYHISENRQRERSAYLKFRRTVVWTKSEIEKTKRSAAEFAQFLGSAKS